MTKIYIYDESSLPEGFEYPQAFIEFINSSGINDIEPWWIIGESIDYLNLSYEALNGLHSKKTLIPFAKTDDGDDIACFDGDDTSGDPRIYFYTGEASLKNVDWSTRYSQANFTEWLETAKQEAAAW